VRAWFAKLGTFLGRFRQRQAGVALYRSATSLVVEADDLQVGEFVEQLWLDARRLAGGLSDELADELAEGEFNLLCERRGLKLAGGFSALGGRPL